MAHCTAQIPTCNGCCMSAQLTHLIWQLGYLRALEDRNAALLERIWDTLRTSSPAPTPQASPWGVRDWVERAELAQRGWGAALGLWRLWRMVSWPASVGMWGAVLGRWAGLL